MFLPGHLTGRQRKETQDRGNTGQSQDSHDIHLGIRIRASIGAALCPEDGLDYETLFKAADEAMYLDKEQSKNRNESREAGEEKQDRTIS